MRDLTEMDIGKRFKRQDGSIVLLTFASNQPGYFYAGYQAYTKEGKALPSYLSDYDLIECIDDEHYESCASQLPKCDCTYKFDQEFIK